MAEGELDKLIEELSGFLDTDSVSTFQDDPTPGKFDDLLSPKGHPMIGIDSKGLPGCAGRYNGRPVYLSFHRCSEMTISVSCRTQCRFRIVRNTLAARLNLLAGRRIRTGVNSLDSRFLVRNTGPCDLTAFFGNSDVTVSIERMIPFYAIEGDPGNILLAMDFNEDEINRDFKTVVERIQLVSRIADMMEEAFPAVDSDDEPAREGGES